MTTAPGPRVLSVKQPWAWAIVSGLKHVENRSWATPYRGTVYIHASRQLDASGIAWFGKHKIKLPRDLPTGAVVGKCELVNVVDRTQGRRFGKWFFGPKGWVVKDPRRLPCPIKMKGQLGLPRASRRLVRKVEGQRSRK
jgi:ASCH domain